tara:strand:+ start:97 stop:630 length:534 start_codon:yes stop_codon:yes gene_type:complete
MHYIVKKLSENDKNILAKIYETLEGITLPIAYCGENRVGSHHARKIGVTNQRYARQTVFGMTYYRGLLQLSSYSKKYPHVMTLFKEFINSHYSQFEFMSVYVNRNTIAKKHLDSKNSGTSLLVGLGPYTGGETILYNKDGVESKFCINTHSLVFNGSKIEHSSETFEGTRYSLVFFN